MRAAILSFILISSLGFSSFAIAEGTHESGHSKPGTRTTGTAAETPTLWNQVLDNLLYSPATSAGTAIGKKLAKELQAIATLAGQPLYEGVKAALTSSMQVCGNSVPFKNWLNGARFKRLKILVKEFSSLQLATVKPRLAPEAEAELQAIMAEFRAMVDGCLVSAVAGVTTTGVNWGQWVASRQRAEIETIKKLIEEHFFDYVLKQTDVVPANQAATKQGLKDLGKK